MHRNINIARSLPLIMLMAVLMTPHATSWVANNFFAFMFGADSMPSSNQGSPSLIYFALIFTGIVLLVSVGGLTLVHLLERSHIKEQQQAKLEQHKADLANPYHDNIAQLIDAKQILDDIYTDEAHTKRGAIDEELEYLRGYPAREAERLAAEVRKDEEVAVAAGIDELVGSVDLQSIKKEIQEKRQVYEMPEEGLLDASA